MSLVDEMKTALENYRNRNGIVASYEFVMENLEKLIDQCRTNEEHKMSEYLTTAETVVLAVALFGLGVLIGMFL